MDTVQTDLEQRLARRQQEKAEMERQLYAVEYGYQEEVAPLKEEVLRLEMERLRRAAQRNMRSARHRNAFHDAQRMYEAYQDERLSPEAVVCEDVKRHYRRASKRCHPDVVPEEYREQAAATFQALESAYEAGHDRAVHAIAEALERWGFPQERPDASGELDSPERADVRRAVLALEGAIAAIRERDAYQVAVEPENVDDVLQAYKRRLLERLHEIRPL